MEKLLQNRVVFVPGETSMRNVIGTMRDRNISSILVTDVDGMVTGIITERDIVQKFTLLELPEKLHAKAFAVMTRPVVMARLSHLYEDVIGLFRARGVRHFPVTIADHHAKNVIGIMTVTDLANAWLTSYTKNVPASPQKMPLVIIAGDAAQATVYEHLFEALGLKPFLDGEPYARLEKAVVQATPILMDIDHLDVQTAKQYLLKVKKHTSVLILLSSDPKLVIPLREHLQGPLTNVCLKPLDISQILSVLHQVEAVTVGVSA